MTITAGEQTEIDHANASDSTPIVFVHGLWLLPGSWRGWRDAAESQGFVTLAPGWPGDPETVGGGPGPPGHVGRQGRRGGHRPLRRGHRRAWTGSRW